jgi:hypothetical protein
MKSMKMSFKDGYRDFRMELDGAEVENVTGATFKVRRDMVPELTLDVQIWDNLEIDAEGLSVKLGSLRLFMDDLHLTTALALMLGEYKNRGLSPELLKEHLG